MNLYGLGVKYGGFTANSRDIFDECIEHNFWCMGYDEKDKFEKLIAEVKIGDIVFSKAFYYENPRDFSIRSIGFVTDKSIPNTVPEEFKNKHGFAVQWTTIFKQNWHLLSTDDFMPQGFMKGIPKDNSRLGTIYRETNDSIILRIIKEMNGPIIK